jgi:hypothetical protein
MFAGTLDTILSVDTDAGRRTLLVDYKTVAKDEEESEEHEPYPESALQVAGYRGATHALLARPGRRLEVRGRQRLYLISPEERAEASPMPAVDGVAILRITPRLARLYIVQDADNVQRAFTQLLGFARWWWPAQSQFYSHPL